MKKNILVICILIIVILFTSAGCKKHQSTISVIGTGTVLAQPDMIQMTITLSNTAQLTRTAQEAVNRMVRQALTILKDAGIEDQNISTASLTFRPEYEYTTRRILIGQRAEQILTFSIDNINNTENERVSRIIDQLIQINGIEMNQINFGVKNNTEYFVRSRELAFQKAAEKANQYAELSNLKIKRVLSISEEMHQQNIPMNRFSNQLVFAESARDAGSTIVPTGELEITTNIMVVFALK